MITEKIITTSKVESVKIVNTKMHSLKKKNIKKTGIRVYKGGNIGVSGFIGEGDENKSLEMARKKLSLEIKHPGPLKNKSVKNNENQEKDVDIKKVQSQIMEYLRENHDDFIFNGVMDFNVYHKDINNSSNLNISDKMRLLLVSLRLKRKKSIKNMEGYIFHIGKDIDIDDFNQHSSKILKAMKKDVPLPDKKRLPVIILHDYFINRFFSRQLHPERLYEDSSIFSDKIGKRIFSEKIDIIINRKKQKNRDRFVIDDEGSNLIENEISLIKNGILRQGFSDIKNSKKYGIENTASASGVYNGVPVPGSENLTIRPTHESLQDIVSGPAIYCVIAAGGDFTMDGSFASPVQSALLYQDGEFLGKLPELNIKTDIYSMLGKDFLGVSEKGPYNTSSMNANVFVCDIK